ncbi:MAG: TIGR03960 family B12-binding radical SAM protein [Firmicutes bacterium]|nr:TIGR03960 family B12-binding radical SAM protein [Bacillota bacterium]
MQQRQEETTLQHILSQVEKPARYLGNEWNAVRKDHQGRITLALAFPDVYEIAMSHLGLQILYHVANQREDTVAERVYAPWTDMESLMRQHCLPLFALESKRPVREFDLVGFTLQYEMSYSNIINMLDLAGIPILARDRGNEHPLVIGGGPCVYNPEPLADFFDFFVLGDAEEVLGEILDAYAQAKSAGWSREQTLLSLSQISGVYVPSFYEVQYHDDGTIASVQPKADVPPVVTKRVLAELKPEYFPSKPVVPYLGTVHDRLSLEIFRGCTRGCRFCQAGVIYRPVRERSREDLVALAEAVLRATGYNEISLMSLSTMDYSDLAALVDDLLAKFGCDHVKLSLPSLRIDSFSIEQAKKVKQGRTGNLTLAPEAGSQRLRDVINKQVTEEDLLQAVSGAQAEGWRSVKLYFMIGLPTETEADLEGIFDLAKKAAWAHRYVKQPGKPMRVTASVAAFVPKPWTPFQWEPQDSMYVLEQKQLFLRELFSKDRRLTLNYHGAELSFLEAIFARGDRRLGRVLLEAHALGCRFDGWSEHFAFDKWMQAFAAAELDPTFYANRRRERDEVLPWDHLSPGVSKEWLWKEREAAWQLAVTPDCRSAHCSVCGVCQHLPVTTRLAKE